MVPLAFSQADMSLEETFRKILEEGVQDKSVESRRQAVIALSLAGTHEPFFSMLESQLADKNYNVRLVAVTSLFDVKGDCATAAIRAWLSVLKGDTKTSSNFFTKQKRDTFRHMQTPKGIFLSALMQGVGLVPVPGLGEGVAFMFHPVAATVATR